MNYVKGLHYTIFEEKNVVVFEVGATGSIRVYKNSNRRLKLSDSENTFVSLETIIRRKINVDDTDSSFQRSLMQQ